MNIPTEPLLQITNRVLIHWVDVIDAAQLIHAETAAARTTAGPSEKEQEPLVARLAPAALLALQDGVIGEFVKKGSLNTDQHASATSTIPRGAILYPKLPRDGNSRENKDSTSTEKVN